MAKQRKPDLRVVTGDGVPRRAVDPETAEGQQYVMVRLQGIIGAHQWLMTVAAMIVTFGLTLWLGVWAIVSLVVMVLGLLLVAGFAARKTLIAVLAGFDEMYDKAQRGELFYD